MNEKITFEKFCDPEFRREEQFKIKEEAVWASFMELDGLVNISKFAEKYFDRSQGWFSQKLYGHVVCGKPRKFTHEECDKIAQSFRELAAELETFAGHIQLAKPASEEAQ